jgi:hypothetical protein
MRNVIWILLGILLVLGCVDSRLTPSELEQCLNSTNSTITHSPICDTQSGCLKKYEQKVGKGSFPFLGVEMNVQLAEKNLIESWKSLNLAQKALKETHNSCLKNSPSVLLNNGILSGTYLEETLFYNERSQQFVLVALQQSVRNAQRFELEKIRDSKAYGAYAELLLILQSIQTKTNKHVIGNKVLENNQYFENAGNTILQQEIGAYDIDLENVFDLYQTTIKITQPGQSKILLAFAPAWQATLTSIQSNFQLKETVKTISLFNAKEIIAHVENGTAVPNGIVVSIIQKIKELENGLQEAFEEMDQTQKRNEQKLQQIEQLVEKLEDGILAIKEQQNKIEQLFSAYDISQTKVETAGIEKYKEFVKINKAKLISQKNQYIEGNKSLGSSIEEGRIIEKELNQVLFEIELIRRQVKMINTNCRLLAKKIADQKSNPAGLIEEAEQFVKNDDPKTFECVSLIRNIVEHNETAVSVTVQTAQLEECSNETSIFADAMGIDSSVFGTGFLLSEFGSEEAAGSACRAAGLNLQQTYEQTTAVKEWNETKQKLKTYFDGISFAKKAHKKSTNKTKADSILSKISSFLTENENKIIVLQKVSEKNQEGIKLIETAQELADKIIQNHVDQTEWKTTAEETILAGKETTISWELELANPFGRTILQPLIVTKALPPNTFFVDSSQANFLLDGNSIILQNEKIQEKPIKIFSKSIGTLATAKETTSVLQVFGNVAQMQTIIEISAKQVPLHVSYRFELPKDADLKTVFVRNDKGLLPVSIEKGAVLFTIELKRETELIIVEYQRNDAVEVNSKLTEQKEVFGQIETIYEITVKNNLSEKVKTNISTGISSNPVVTTSTKVFFEGKEVSFNFDHLFGIVINNAGLLPNQTKKYFADITAVKDETVWNSLIQNLLYSVSKLANNGSISIATRAAKIRGDLSKLLNTNNSEKIADTLPALHNKIRELEKEAEKEELESLKLDKETKPMIEETEKEKSVAENSNAETIYSIQNKTKEILENISNYQKELALSCSKLSEVGYLCPVSEKTLREIKNETKENDKKINGLIKIFEKIQDEKLKQKKLEENLPIISEIENENEKQEKILLEARTILEKSASALLKKIKEKAGYFQETKVAENIEKAEDSFEKREFGKTIFIAKNLLNYFSSSSPEAGLVSFPAEAWPLLGLLLAGISFIGYKKYNSKNKPEIIPTSLPKADPLSKKPLRVSRQMKEELPK